MTPEKVLSTVELYRSLFKRTSTAPSPFPHEAFMDGELQSSLRHCHSMLDEIITFVGDGRIDKAFRWLGFIQGVLWVNGMFTLQDLKEHNWTEKSE